jgi:hypothetical protein
VSTPPIVNRQSTQTQTPAGRCSFMSVQRTVRVRQRQAVENLWTKRS